MLHVALITLLSLASPALAAPAGFKQVKAHGGCEFYVGPKQASGFSQVHVDCLWDDVTSAGLDATLTDLEGHARVHSTISSAKVLSQAGGGTVVRQIHKQSGISPRQADMRFVRTSSGPAITWSWSMNPEQTPVDDGHVRIGKNNGSWAFEPAPAGGLRVIYKLDYEPGGSVASWLVRWFQTSAVVAFVDEMRSASR